MQTPNLITYGNTPKEILANHVSWLTESFIVEVISRKLEIKDLIKLLPKEPGGAPERADHPLQRGSFLCIASKTTTVTEGGATAYDKDIPDFSTLISILSTYGLLRSIFDRDNTGIGAAVFVYMKTLSKWYKHNRYTFSSLRSYFIAHFRKYQTSNDPNVWMAVDAQLFIENLHAAPPNETSNPHRDQQSNRRFNFNVQQSGLAKGSASKSICLKYNNGLKNCTWSERPRQHICDTCGGSHPAFKSIKRPNFGGRMDKS